MGVYINGITKADLKYTMDRGVYNVLSTLGNIVELEKPHGRLISEDEALSRIMNETDAINYPICTKDDLESIFRWIIEKTSTVIESEGE